MEKILRTCGYVRVSTAIQAEEGESIETQKTQIIDFIKLKNWELINIYSDVGATGTKIEFRIEFQKMINDAKEGKFDAIVFTKLSRFARNARDYQNYLHELKQYGVQLISIKENVDPTTHMGKMIAGMLALFAEWEHETIREQMYENKMAKWKDNRTFIGKPPFGYIWNKEKKKLEIYQPDADVYHRVVRMYCDQGMAMRDIAIKLNAEGLKCKRAVWNSATISYMLKNPVYYGHYVVNQFIYEDGKRGAGTKRTNRRKPESEAITFEVDPLISKSEWDNIQIKTAHNKIITKRTGEHTMDFFLRNVVVCARCGSKMNARIGSMRKDGTFPRYYVCYYAGTSKKSIESGREKCDLPYIKAQAVENAVFADIVVMFALNPKKAFNDMFDPIKYQEKIDKQILTISRLESELNRNERTNKRLKRLIRELDDDKYNSDDLRLELRNNSDEKITILNNFNDARDSLKELRKLEEKEKEVFDFMNKNEKELKAIRRDIHNLSMADWKILAEAMLEGPVTVDYEDPIPGEHAGGVSSSYSLRYNPEIIKRFMEEGKIGQLKQNSSDNNASAYS